MRVLIIGGTGHVGTYLVPRLVAAGHEVVCMTRGRQKPYLAARAWDDVQTVIIDRENEEKSGTFGRRVKEVEADVVIDMICFTLDSASQLVEALRGQVKQLLHCGTIWVHGHSVEVPTTEDQPRHPFGSYGIQKVEIESYLLAEARNSGFPATVLHPGHIVGKGWWPLNPCGHFNPQAFTRLAKGEVVSIPNLGMETVHHVHVDDVAQAFIKAMENQGAAIGENFHVVSPAALTLRGYAETVASWFGRPPNLVFLPWESWQKNESAVDAAATWDHIAHSPNCSIKKAQRLLNYQPKYDSLAAVKESLDFLMESGDFTV